MRVSGGVIQRGGSGGVGASSYSYPYPVGAGDSAAQVSGARGVRAALIPHLLGGGAGGGKGGGHSCYGRMRRR